MADIKEKVICPWCKEEMRPYPHQGYYWFQCKCGARTPTLWHATEEQTRKRALSYTADVVPKSEGKWKPYKDYFTHRQIGWICTNCSSVVRDLSNGDTDFCPHCGAVMETESEDTE